MDSWLSSRVLDSQTTSTRCPLVKPEAGADRVSVYPLRATKELMTSFSGAYDGPGLKSTTVPRCGPVAKKTRLVTEAVSGESLPFLSHVLPGQEAAKEISDHVLSFLPNWIDARTMRLFFTTLPRKYWNMTVEELQDIEYREPTLVLSTYLRESSTYTDSKAIGNISGKPYLARSGCTSSDEGMEETSLREIAFLTGCRHRNIISLLHLPHIIPGSKLRTALEWPGKNNLGEMRMLDRGCDFLKPPLLKRCMYQLLQGVSFLHSHGVVNSNLKPQNLFLAASGVLKISNFYSAGFVGNEWRVGTLWYRPPELLLTDNPVHQVTTDVWAIGAIFSELATGRPLFAADSEIDLLFRIFRALGTPTELTWPGVSTYTHFQNEFPKWKRTMSQWNYPMLGSEGFLLLNRFLTYPPADRISCDDALRHPYFREVGESLEPSSLSAENDHATERASSVERKIQEYWREREQSLPLPSVDSFLRDTEVTPDMREILVDWLVDVVQEFAMKQDTLYWCMHYVDRCLNGLLKVTPRTLQLLGCGCMLIARKMMLDAVTCEELAEACDNCYSASDIADMESKVLAAFKCDIICVTPLHFLRQYRKRANEEAIVSTSGDGNQQILCLSMYLSELGLHEYALVPFRPSEQAAAAIALARRTLGLHPIWSPSLFQCTGYELEDLFMCEKILLEAHLRKKDADKLVVTRNKYATAKYQNVSNILPLTHEAFAASVQQSHLLGKERATQVEGVATATNKQQETTAKSP